MSSMYVPDRSLRSMSGEGTLESCVCRDGIAAGASIVSVGIMH